MPKKFQVILISLLLFPSLSNAQYDFSFSGYVVNMPIYQLSNEKLSNLFSFKKNMILDLTRIRLRPTLHLWSSARINAEYEIAGLYFNSIGNFLIVPSNKTNRQLCDLTWNPVDEKNYSVVHFVDRLSFRQEFENGNIEIGRQRIAWGTGRIWNPTDLFNPINPAAYYKLEKDGADVVSLKYAFGNFTDLNIVFNPQEKLNKSNYAFRFRTNFDEYDVSVMGGYFDQRIVAGMDFAGNLGKAGFRGEGIISIDKNDFSNNFVKFILGADQQFTPKLYGMIEYHFNGEGKKDKLKYEFARLIKGEIINLSQNYVYTMLSYQLSPLLSVSLSNNINLNDGSGFIGGSGNYPLTENFYLNLGLQIIYGSDNTEYWYYPNSIYLEGEYYF
ncbi:hypothetical protein ABRY23_04990 [Melioribacteraceae bacterium 4301-Me]|uniref:hypothetical protein n=1 Tax=Pyranulibacter aquaticus TaxID=3163344 RepID=UPI0035987626